MANHKRSSSFTSFSSSPTSDDDDGTPADTFLNPDYFANPSNKTTTKRASRGCHGACGTIKKAPSSCGVRRALIAFLISFSLFLVSRNLFNRKYPPPGSDAFKSSVIFAEHGHYIPPKIWQVMFTAPNTNPETNTPLYDFPDSQIPYTASWIARNPGYQYTMMTTATANAFVDAHRFPRDSAVRAAHYGLRNHGPRSDLLRYLHMYADGGVYSDTDVTCLRPIDTWVPAEWRGRVKAVVGIERDSLGGDTIAGMLWDVQFGQWTVAAVPRHRLFKSMIENVVDHLAHLCRVKNTTIDQLAMTEIEIMNATATALWSETIFNELKRITANSDQPLEKPSDLSGMTQPRLYDDIMVLPIDYIGSGVPHSNASPGIPDFALVKHHFSGSWRTADGIENRGEKE